MAGPFLLPWYQAKDQTIPRFVKGQSGNPLGRPKVARTWSDQCREFYLEADGWERLVAIARSKVDQDALPALKLIAEYAFGKPQQHMDVTTGGQTLVKAYMNVDLDQACPPT